MFLIFDKISMNNKIPKSNGFGIRTCVSFNYRKLVRTSRHELFLTRPFYSKNYYFLQDPVSLTRAMISKNAITFRQHASVVLADVIYRRMLKASIGGEASGRYAGLPLEVEGQAKTSYDSQFYTIMRDQRLRLIFYRILGQVRRHPVLMVRACWSCFTIVAMALVISLPRFIASCSQSFFSSLSFLPRKIAVGF